MTSLQLILANLPYMARGLKVTLWLAVASLLGSLLLGTILAMLRTSPWPWLRLPIRLLVDGMRMIPLIMVIFWIFFLIPILTGHAVAPVTAVITALILFNASYMAEIIRAGIESVPRGLNEAARAAGFSALQSLSYVVLPLAFRTMLPAMVNRFVTLFMATSLAYTIGVTEFFRAASEVNFRVFQPNTIYGFVALVYFVFCWDSRWPGNIWPIAGRGRRATPAHERTGPARPGALFPAPWTDSFRLKKTRRNQCSNAPQQRHIGPMANTVDNALSVLFAIADAADEEVTLTSLALALKMPKANVLRFLTVLEQHRLIVREDDRRIRLGFAVLALADAFHMQVPLAQRSLRHLRWLRDATDETSAVQIRIGTERSCIQQVESPAAVRWAVPLGRRYPVASGAAGKVLLAFMNEAERDALLLEVPYRPLTPRSEPDLESFLNGLKLVRRKGFALSEDETRLGGSAAGAPVYDHTGTVVAALTVAGPSDRVGGKRLIELAQPVVQAAAALSADLGWTGSYSKAGSLHRG